MSKMCRRGQIAVAVAGVAVAVTVYYFYSKNRKSTIVEVKKDEPPKSEPEKEKVEEKGDAEKEKAAGEGEKTEERTGAGMDVKVADAGPKDFFNCPDDRVKQAFHRIFIKEMDLGETLMEKEETEEKGAIHLSNAIEVTGDAENLLKVLRKSLPPQKYATIQKYMPTAGLRVNQLLQDELDNETIDQVFENKW